MTVKTRASPEVIWHVASVHNGTPICFCQGLILRKAPKIPSTVVQMSVRRHFNVFPAYKSNLPQMSMLNISDECRLTMYKMIIQNLQIRKGVGRVIIFGSSLLTLKMKTMEERLPSFCCQEDSNTKSSVPSYSKNLYNHNLIPNMEALQKELAKIQVSAPDISSLP